MYEPSSIISLGINLLPDVEGHVTCPVCVLEPKELTVLEDGSRLSMSPTSYKDLEDRLLLIDDRDSMESWLPVPIASS